MARFFAKSLAVRYGGNQAFFSPAGDHIKMPLFGSFRDVASSMRHRVMRWLTGRRSRTGRPRPHLVFGRPEQESPGRTGS
ncbi:zincin-like metallopeptidase domain-containing protein [Rhizobium sp. BK181]|uniref:zincin-like metallopeptidase domain-containing protein n=1 Tax=Rhizobium sp. BK181 TaxID=2587072 RepID=UPI0028A9EB0A|nr:zincin-like metallopeptidase domain-containing protein [Rhizobium sp. BK181]